MMGLIPIAIAFQVQVGVTVGSDSAQKARQNAQRAEREAMFEAGAPPRRPQTFHRIPLTDAMRASAFKDPAARDLLLRARAARLKQDSALASYDATTYQRVSAGLGFKAFGRDRLAMRAEEVSRVQWEKGRGALNTPSPGRPDAAAVRRVRGRGFARRWRGRRNRGGRSRRCGG